VDRKTLPIQIVIADVILNLNVFPEDEERVRKAGKIVQQRLDELKLRNKNDDTQKLLAKVALDVLNLKLLNDIQATEQENNILDKLSGLESLFQNVH